MKAGSRMLRRFIAAFILFFSLFTCVRGLTEESFPAEIARQWTQVRSNLISPEAERQSFLLLRLVMDGIFLEETEDELGTRILAAAFPILAGIPEEDVPAFSTAYSLPETLVEQAWWLSLANALRASLRMEPLETRTQANAILEQWLKSPDVGGAAANEALLLEVAGKYGLPLRFVRFLSDGKLPGGQITSKPAETHWSDQNDVTPEPLPGTGTNNGSENGQQGPGGQNDDAGPPQKRR